mmetsp:Transcript_4021/g.6865  ORF Transcript_4021/g.6865 Transcript_4021/m.6865 type:complete len:345 (+) Transcript_4021:152-1186(+)|eukprot:CAMPEP_0198201760 /NCGR_PEP_ID=MMETSP1445-20131203/4768_1 /TAXON_ID=36898 /ORGANISM="Pyramimonas sp., Strain CCMP2087" /LENGTH=344 /DNA_ID=CAMNT_0043872345 /DNA_START=127 /DNA_END=1161 /DNA_ORIENTATION=-
MDDLVEVDVDSDEDQLYDDVKPTSRKMEGIEEEGAPSEEKPTQGETAPITEDKPLAAAALASHPDDNATKTISNLTIMLEEKYAEISGLKSESAKKQAALDQWRNAFRDEAKGGDPDPGLVLDSLLALRSVERKLHEQARDHTKTENALLFRLAAKEQEVHEMKTQLHDLKQTKQAETAETHKLLLDPAVHREFVRLQGEVEEQKKQLHAANEELEAVKYTPDSKNGRRLRARLQTWQKENEELALLVSEGKVHRLECELAMLKDYLSEIKRVDHELLEDAELLELESVELHQYLFTNKGQSNVSEETKNKHGEKKDSKLDNKETIKVEKGRASPASRESKRKR